MQSKWDTSCLSVSWAACAVVFGHLLLHNLLRLTLKNKSFVLYASTLTGSVAGTREGKRSRRYYSDARQHETCSPLPGCPRSNPCAGSRSKRHHRPVSNWLRFGAWLCSRRSNNSSTSCSNRFRDSALMLPTTFHDPYSLPIPFEAVLHENKMHLLFHKHMQYYRYPIK